MFELHLSSFCFGISVAFFSQALICLLDMLVESKCKKKKSDYAVIRVDGLLDEGNNELKEKVD